MRVTEDREANRGPLEGLFVGLSAMRHEWSFLLGCDMPFVQRETLLGMYGFCNDGTDAAA